MTAGGALALAHVAELLRANATSDMDDVFLYKLYISHGERLDIPAQLNARHTMQQPFSNYNIRILSYITKAPVVDRRCAAIRTTIPTSNKQKTCFHFTLGWSLCIPRDVISDLSARCRRRRRRQNRRTPKTTTTTTTTRSFRHQLKTHQ